MVRARRAAVPLLVAAAADAAGPAAAGVLVRCGGGLRSFVAASV